MLTLKWNWLVQSFSLAYLAFPFDSNGTHEWYELRQPMHQCTMPNQIEFYDLLATMWKPIFYIHIHLYIGSVAFAFSINKIECSMGYGFSVKCRHSEQLAHCWKSMHSNIAEWQWQIFVSIPNAHCHWIYSECLRSFTWFYGNSSVRANTWEQWPFNRASKYEVVTPLW